MVHVRTLSSVVPPANLDDQHLVRLRDYYARHGALPSYARIGEVVGFKAKNAAVKLAARLTDAGYLRSAPGGKLAPTARFFELPLFDSPVQAGAAVTIPGQEAGELMTIDSYLIEAPSKTVLLRIKGDSMQDAGVLDGDLAVVERSRSASAGEFIVAVVDGEFTVKELGYESEQPILIPHNDSYPCIRPESDLEIFGIVRGIVRKVDKRWTGVRRAAFGVSK
jgi:SOS-response transcriptional repressor LexA